MLIIYVNSETYQTFKMGRLAKIVNAFQQLITFAQCSFVDV